MVSSSNQPEIQPPPRELPVASAMENTETLEECVDEMELCDHTMDSFPLEEEYGFPPLSAYVKPDLYSAFCETSTALLNRLQETIAGGYELELLKACFKRPELGKDPLQRAPEDGDESSKIYYAFLQKIINKVPIHELAAIFRWNSYTFGIEYDSGT